MPMSAVGEQRWTGKGTSTSSRMISTFSFASARSAPVMTSRVGWGTQAQSRSSGGSVKAGWRCSLFSVSFSMTSSSPDRGLRALKTSQTRSARRMLSKSQCSL